MSVTKSQAEKLANYLICTGILKKEKFEEYSYILEIDLDKIFTYISLFFLSVCIGKVVESLFFLLFFFGTRERTGGMHADQFWKCYISTMMIYLGTEIWLIPALQNRVTLQITILFISFLIILKSAPINHPNLSLDNEEMIICRKSIKYMILIDSIIFMAMIFIHINEIYFINAELGIGIVALLIIIAKMQGQEVKNSYEG